MLLSGGEKITENYNNFYNKVHKILIVDDEEDELNALSLTVQYAKDFKSEISIAENANAALAEMDKQNFDLVLSDFRMPTMDGIEFLNRVKEKHPDTIRMLITACSDIEIAKNAINKAEVHSYVEKPWYNDELRTVIYDALKKKDEIPKKDHIEVGNVNDALQVINTALGKIFYDNEKSELKRRVILEFTSPAEFNKFYQEIKQLKNVSIDDVQIYKNKYFIELRF